MAKIRLYYNKSGKILEVEHRPDENYTKDNSRQSNAEAKWIVVESEDVKAQSIEELEIKGGKLAKKRSRGR